MAQGSEDALRPLLRNYRFRDLTLMEVRLAGARYAELHPGRDVYGFEYNMPVRLWLPESFPYSPPLAFVQPTQDMILNPGHHVDSRGRVYLPYLQHWTHVSELHHVWPPASHGGRLCQGAARIGSPEEAHKPASLQLLAVTKPIDLTKGPAWGSQTGEPVQAAPPTGCAVTLD
ncbi:unnamed protein product [Lampetra planeri]